MADIDLATETNIQETRFAPTNGHTSNGARYSPISTFSEPADLTTTAPADASQPTPLVVAVIPAYNEDRFIGSMVIKTRAHAELVIVVDDGSRDNTVAVAEAAGARVLRHSTNRGKAAALALGLRHARTVRPDAIMVMLDGDGQHNPDEIPSLVAPIAAGEAEVVVGSRFLEVRSDIPGWRVMGQTALTTATNVLSGHSLTDSQSGYRAFAPHVLKDLRFSQAGFSVESEMQFLAAEFGWKVHEVPIGVVYAEPAKRNPVRHGLQVLNGMLQLTGQIRPLLFFGLPGVLLFVSGIALGSAVVSIYDATHSLAVGYSLITVMLTILGTLSMFTGLMLHSVRGLFVQFSQRHTVE